jgi:hypothetical protein
VVYKSTFRSNTGMQLALLIRSDDAPDNGAGNVTSTSAPNQIDYTSTK